MYHAPGHSQVKLIQLVKFFLPVRRRLLGDFNFMLTNPRNFESQCYDCIFMKNSQFFWCLKTFKIIFSCPELIVLPLICCWSARYKRFYNFSISFYSCLKTLLIAFPFQTLKVQMKCFFYSRI